MGAYLSVVCLNNSIPRSFVSPIDEYDKKNEFNKKNKHFDIIPFVMCESHKQSLQKHYHNTLMQQAPDAFHRTMLQCINSSPKINEIIACQKYCYRDLTRWPKLNRLSTAQINFFDGLIYQKHLEEEAVAEAVYTLGVVHYGFSQYGMKAHFLDLWHQHFTKILMKLKFADESEKDEFLAAFNVLNKYIVDVMNVAYAKCQQDAARCGVRDYKKTTIPNIEDFEEA